MAYDVDRDYPLERPDGEDGLPLFPDSVSEDKDGLYVLPNGRYLPRGAYLRPDGSCLIYEPHQLSPFADLLASCTEE